MSFKKSLGVLGLAAVGLLTGQQTINQSMQIERGVSISDKSSQGSKVNNQQSPVTPQKQAVNQKIVVKNLPKARITPQYSDRGCPPKEWGQYLQRTRRQKWVKAA